MSLTPAQLTALKTDALANTNTIPAGQPWTGSFSGQQVKDVFANTSGDASAAVAGWYGLTASPNFSVWQTAAKVKDILDAITWANFTPTSAVDDATLTTALIAAQRQTQLLAIQTKQMNLQNMVIGRDTVDASKANIRAGLRDCVVNLPSGAAGANVQAAGASGVTVMNTLTRLANNIEKLLVTSSATTGTVTASIMGYEGSISGNDVDQARNS
jgi:hypothetical protein